MTEPKITNSSQWHDAEWAAAVFAVAPATVGGIVLHAYAGPVREHWMAQLRALFPADMPIRTVPLNITEGRLIGGLDLAATLRAGRAVADRGLLVEINHGVGIITGAERVGPRTAALITQCMDAGGVVLERDGMTLATPTRYGIIAIDESREDELPISHALADRLAFHIELEGVAWPQVTELSFTRAEIARAQKKLPRVKSTESAARALCAAAMALGIESLRAPLLALSVARIAAALDGASHVEDEHVALAARLVLLPRAKQLPLPADDNETSQPNDQSSQSSSETSEPNAAENNGESRADLDETREIVLEAARAALPEDLLNLLKHSAPRRTPSRLAGRASETHKSSLRGRPAGVRRGDPRSGARLNVIETLRAAAPWQRLRGRNDSVKGRVTSPVQVRREDFRVTQYKRNTETTTIFVVDASGSAALHRLAEAKGAVELLLAECYVRRDRVALIAFRGRSAELLLPPTRSLARAKRTLAGLPGGGGTPLAAGLDAAFQLGESVRRRGGAAILIVLTDGRANVARDGVTERSRAEKDAHDAARLLANARLTSLVVDTSPRPQPQSQKLAADMGASYLPLPHADATTLSTAIRASTRSQMSPVQ